MPIISFSFLPYLLDSDAVGRALLQHQFFPNVKASGEELPPFFDSLTFTKKVANQLANQHLGKAATDFVTFRSRRFDGLVRRMGLPHPVTYSKLVNHICDHWAALTPYLDSPESMIKPSSSYNDNRIITMNYGSPTGKVVGVTRAAQSKRYVVNADISNCFPSLYSHSIDWALRGFTTAKKDRKGKTWQEQLDKHVRNCHDGETKGVMIGPAVSNLISEVVLQQVDAELRGKGDFVRYIDDYTAYFTTREDAEEFVARLDSALSGYRLVLNSKKTAIHSLRSGFGDAWINDIQSHLPKTRGAVAAIRFLQQCESLAHHYPDQSVLLYGVKTLLNLRKCPRLGQKPRRSPKIPRELAILDEIVRINYFHPHLSCFVVRQLSYVAPLLSGENKDRLAKVLLTQLLEAVHRNETDTILWLLYAIRVVLKRRLTMRSIKAILQLDDDLVWLAVACTSARGLEQALKRAKEVDKDDATECEQHWLSRYELYRAGHLKLAYLNSAAERPWFTASKKLGLRFSTL